MVLIKQKKIELVLESHRLTMTPIVLADTDMAIEIWTDPRVLKHICEVPTPEQVRNEMPDVVKRGGNGAIGVWSVADRVTGEKLGETFLLPMPVEADDIDYSLIVMDEMPDADIEIGYFLKPAAWGQGYGTEICTRMLQFAFQATTLNEVVASVNADNVGSKNVLKKSGFQHCGQARCWGEDNPIFKISRESWSASQL